jgi:tetratricopeptide (TPR) repeat protein
LAIADINKAIKINPEYAIAYRNRGFAYYNKGLYDQAIADYSKAIEIDPEYADAYINRGYTYFEKGFYDKAIDDYNKTLELNPEHPYAYKNLLKLRQKMKDDQEKEKRETD